MILIGVSITYLAEVRQGILFLAKGSFQSCAQSKIYPEDCQLCRTCMKRLFVSFVKVKTILLKTFSALHTIPTHEGTGLFSGFSSAELSESLSLSSCVPPGYATNSLSHILYKHTFTITIDTPSGVPDTVTCTCQSSLIQHVHMLIATDSLCVPTVSWPRMSGGPLSWSYSPPLSHCLYSCSLSLSTTVSCLYVAIGQCICH